MWNFRPLANIAEMIISLVEILCSEMVREKKDRQKSIVRRKKRIERIKYAMEYAET